MPVVGGLIVWFRSAWNSVSTKWYVRPIAAQQSAFNETVVEKLEADLTDIKATLGQAESAVSTLDGRLVDQDRDQVQTIHDLGELTAQLTALRDAVMALEARLVQLESDND